ncbi:PilZ domain-containing protein [Bacteriovorax sp. Seq25_V]|uniref:PilZ domain-containing protein n=1 Tax=Bacteriovorax sp. Seq25_V TaxID=1201288 RepID=UPI00038A2E7E|nr:PilZ domain-containing protein [Bacteriovorax sp. Seq25_V]EQC46021.1 hypothetical protein M900_1716 [Bacteriovorax sp. Seq25_V]
MSDANKKYYFTQIDQEEVKSFLSKAVKDKQVAAIWQKGQDKDAVEEFEILGFDEVSMRLDLGFKASLLAKITGSKNKDSEILLKITFGSLYIFTTSILKFDKEKDYYTAIIDRDIFKSQQRSNYRLMANRFIKIQFKIDNEVFDALDISAGGTSFIVPTEMKERFPKEQIFQGCVLRLAGVNYTIPEAKIAGTWDSEFKDGSGNIVAGLKIGISFVDLPKKIEEDLFLSINTEARGEELRKKAAAAKQG